MKTPCIKVCRIDPKTHYCTGCLRSLSEIGGWSRMSDDERQTIMNQLEKRRGTTIL